MSLVASCFAKWQGESSTLHYAANMPGAQINSDKLCPRYGKGSDFTSSIQKHPACGKQFYEMQSRAQQNVGGFSP